MKYRDSDIIYSKKLNDGDCYVTYNQYDMGKKYRVITLRTDSRSIVAFDNIMDAYNYFDKI